MADDPEDGAKDRDAEKTPTREGGALEPELRQDMFDADARTDILDPELGLDINNAHAPTPVPAAVLSAVSLLAAEVEDPEPLSLSPKALPASLEDVSA